LNGKGEGKAASTCRLKDCRTEGGGHSLHSTWNARRFGPCVLRRALADHSLRARPNLRGVQELLGHSSVTTTQRYTHMDADDLRRQVAELPANRLRA
jgi:site-specific recombinase XerD